jgi:hypothetical protein
MARLSMPAFGPVAAGERSLLVPPFALPATAPLSVTAFRCAKGIALLRHHDARRCTVSHLATKLAGNRRQPNRVDATKVSNTARIGVPPQPTDTALEVRLVTAVLQIDADRPALMRFGAK